MPNLYSYPPTIYNRLHPTHQMTDHRTLWLWVPELRGDTYIIDPAEPSTTYIGTNDLIRCVGLELPIDETRCFTAHVNPFVHKPGSENAVMDVSEEDGQEIKKRTLEILRKGAEGKGWSPEDVRACGGRKVVIMCPYFDETPIRKTMVGNFVVDGIKEFLGGHGGMLVEYYDDQALIGFVVDHSTGEVHLFKRRPTGKTTWEEVDERFEKKYPKKPGTWDRGDLDCLVEIKKSEKTWRSNWNPGS